MAKQTREVQKADAQSIRTIMARYEPQIRELAPRQLNPQRMMRLYYTALGAVPKLAECTATSLIGSMLESAALGLEVGVAGQAWLLPFHNARKGVTEARLIVGYRGLADLAWRSEKVSAIRSRAVFKGDHFRAIDGTKLIIEYEAADREEEQPIVAAFAVIETTKGGTLADWMFVHEIERIRKRSRAGESGPWQTDYPEMAKKTVLRRLLKLAPVSIEAAQAVDFDEAADRGEQITRFEASVESAEAVEEVAVDQGDRLRQARRVEPEPPAQEPDGEPMVERSAARRS